MTCSWHNNRRQPRPQTHLPQPRTAHRGLNVNSGKRAGIPCSMLYSEHEITAARDSRCDPHRECQRSRVQFVTALSGLLTQLAQPRACQHLGGSVVPVPRASHRVVVLCAEPQGRGRCRRTLRARCGLHDGLVRRRLGIPHVLGTPLQASQCQRHDRLGLVHIQGTTRRARHPSRQLLDS
jgi:hypothetical protein